MMLKDNNYNKNIKISNWTKNWHKLQIQMTLLQNL